MKYDTYYDKIFSTCKFIKVDELLLMIFYNKN